MPKELPFFKWYVLDAETDENFKAMSDAEVGFYLRCLDHSWINQGLPADLKERALVLNRSTAYIRRMWVRVGRCFEPSPTDQHRLINPRQEQERTKALSRSDAASKSIRTRWERNTNEYTNVIPSALARAVSVSVSESVSSSLSETQKSQNGILAGAAAVTDRFKDFWAKYPVKEGKSAARAMWQAVVKPEDVDQVLTCLDHYLASERGERFPKNPNNWLRDCARDNWQSSWPKQKKIQNKTEEMLDRAEELMNED
jgi:hypothetical protein